jgi:putative membrane protein
MTEAQGKEQKRVLILCVDRDGDLEVKAGVKTPVVGRTGNLDAAVALALHDPEEPDANAIFEAVRIYDRLKNEGKSDEILEIATLSGSESGGVRADRKIAAGLDDLLASYPAKEVILVTDGYSDEAVLPLVQSRIPVSSVRRIVIKHSESIEETAALFSRYLKLIAENSKYSRVALGIPGILLLILGALAIFGWVQYYLIVLLIVLSAGLVVKGFGVDKAARKLYRWAKEYSPPPIRVQISNYSTLAGALCVILSVYLGWTTAASGIVPPADLAGWFSILAKAAGLFIQGSITLIIVGACVALLGRAIRWYLERDVRLLRNAAFIVIIGWSDQIFVSTSDLLLGNAGIGKLILSIVVGILIGVASVLVIFVVHKYTKSFFRETEEQAREFGEG